MASDGPNQEGDPLADGQQSTDPEAQADLDEAGPSGQAEEAGQAEDAGPSGSGRATAPAKRAPGRLQWGRGRQGTGQWHPPLSAYGGFKLAREQHKENLQVLLRESLLQHRFRRTAAVAAAIMTCQESTRTDPAGVTRPVDWKDAGKQRFSEALIAGYEVLARAPEACSYDQLKRYLRKMQVLLHDPRDAEMATLELASLMITKGELQDAYDLLTTQLTKHAEVMQQYQRAYQCGLIRHQQWQEAMVEAARKAAGAHAASDEPLTLFKHDALLWSQSGRQAHEYWRDAETHIKEALGMQPDNSQLAYVLVEMYMAAGKASQAMEVAEALRVAAPQDADAHALWILVKQTQGGDQEDAERLLQAFLDLLRCDPATDLAIQGLLGLNDRLDLPAEQVVRGIIMHLDAVKPSSTTSAWQDLAQLLQLHAPAAAEEDADPACVQAWARIDKQVELARGWWGSYHFTAAADPDQLSMCDDDSELLLCQRAKAICAAFVCGTQHEFVGRVVQALTESGHGSLAQDVQDAAHLADDVKAAVERGSRPAVAEG
ncbi:hypothetical protein WJX72_012387 [[Myrmecia] bisecta]|uniref:Uncharacterized protein n=1 Tax=[Myrmecia] bisecta TaxID=41462 RepID=A0AAW1RAG7_9CHLO